MYKERYLKVLYLIIATVVGTLFGSGKVWHPWTLELIKISITGTCGLIVGANWKSLASDK